MSKFLAFTSALLLVAAPPALAQVTSIDSSNAAPKQVAGNPNRVICEAQDTIGTRLGRRKVCLTAQQWAEKRAEHRVVIEDLQLKGQETTCPQKACN
jgi:invasion protein IalB